MHLYRKGQSRRGPAFRVPFHALLVNKCHSLIEKYLVCDGIGSPNPRLGPGYLEAWSRRNLRTRIELYIPPPRKANKEQGIQFHLAIRNFVAWVFRRSVVGENLGTALIDLLGSMEEFRCEGENNVDDLIGYMDEEGYLDMKNRPIHALAMLHLAEHYQLRDLYIDAFTHCSGMSDRLFAIPEYQVSIPRRIWSCGANSAPR